MKIEQAQHFIATCCPFLCEEWYERSKFRMLTKAQFDKLVASGVIESKRIGFASAGTRW